MNHLADIPTPVSSASELLIRVDSADNDLGTVSKAAAHVEGGCLHRAFSIFLFSDDNRVLLQKRATDKPLWPGYWTNTCCSHPRVGETYDEATARRLDQELGLACPLHYVYTFEYSADFEDKGTEHELCSVYVGKIPTTRNVHPHPQEVEDWGWYDCSTLDVRVVTRPEGLTPWFLLEWQELRYQRWAQVCEILGIISRQ